jgi:hypothetical protein
MMFQFARCTRFGWVILLALLVMSTIAWAQQGSTISGTVTDTSGGVLPGVTIEVSSPVLIEGARVAFSDGEGRFNVVGLGPGQYTVTFTLPGFQTFVRDGIELTSGVTAQVDGELPVGSLEETITVTGQSPLVDVQNVRRQSIVTSQMLDALPTSTKHWNALMVVTPGLTGLAQVSGGYQSLNQTFHGKGGAKLQVDGMGVNHPDNGSTGYNVNGTTVQEMVLQTSGISAESNADGATMNMIPKEGGNAFTGYVLGLYAGEKLQSDNLTQELQDKGLTTVSKVLKIYDTTFTLGGPIKQNKLWFFTSQREWGNAHQLAGLFWNATQGSPHYTPDLSRPADRRQWYESHSARLTWQASNNNKLNVFADVSDTCQCRSTGALRGDAPEAATQYHNRPAGLYQVGWTSTVSSRLLLEAAGGYTLFHWPAFYADGVLPTHTSIQEQSSGMRYNADDVYQWQRDSDRPTMRASISYVTGSHNVKVGWLNEVGISNYSSHVNGNVDYRFNNGVPNRVRTYATPYVEMNRFNDMGFFAQDQWTMERLTLNLGVRLDYFNAWVPAQEVAETPFLPARSYDRIDNVPNWKDINPRLGLAYDVTGDGRTALKVSMGRYVAKLDLDIPASVNLINAVVNRTNRSWDDTNGDFIPDCDLTNGEANGECGPYGDSNFGSPKITREWDPELLSGFGLRDYNWDFASEIQHELLPGLSLTAGYYRNWYGNFQVTDNTMIEPSDFDSFCVTAPSDPGLPGGGGNEICGLANISDDKFGQRFDYVTKASNFGDRTLVNDFINVSFSARLDGGASFGGGVDGGKTVANDCFVVDDPQQLLYCETTKPFGSQAQVKFNGSFPLPGDVVISGVYQNLPGPQIGASFNYTTAEAAESLGRPLAGRRKTGSVQAYEPWTLTEGRTTRVDLRLTKNINLGDRFTLRGNFDLYNALNASSVLIARGVLGSSWQRPTSVLDARIIQFSAQLSY